MMKHQHREAFCHMQYFGVGRPGRIILSIWNSRDGVTPFITFSKEYGIELQHTEFQKDRYEPLYKPKKGDLIWSSHNEQTARASAEKYYNINAQHLAEIKLLSPEEISKKYPIISPQEFLENIVNNKEAFIKETLDELLINHGEPQPRLELVKEDWK